MTPLTIEVPFIGGPWDGRTIPRRTLCGRRWEVHSPEMQVPFPTDLGDGPTRVAFTRHVYLLNAAGTAMEYQGWGSNK